MLWFGNQDLCRHNSDILCLVYNLNSDWRFYFQNRNNNSTVAWYLVVSYARHVFQSLVAWGSRMKYVTASFGNNEHKTWCWA